MDKYSFFLLDNDFISISNDSSESDDIMRYKCQSCYLLKGFAEMTLLKCFNQQEDICTNCYIKTTKIINYINNIELTSVLRDPNIQINHFKIPKKEKKERKLRKKIKKDRKIK